MNAQKQQPSYTVLPNEIQGVQKSWHDATKNPIIECTRFIIRSRAFNDGARTIAICIETARFTDTKLIIMSGLLHPMPGLILPYVRTFAPPVCVEVEI